ncbi:uncharacterized protein F4822DRAFT_444328 [Hypoxylon trugodes]|uniref:uncharacterized protein n=1 Tax=Hypoxylon trugodes TaxID=326681 RepID=UPI0021A21487|nr:uncharacterized protein F4822DRAFT_444328 [Hypoxylon trugodes]KAI1387726.1 hypothetical protein F4822DRAFT_444328 [Hypoxylon trugodes]
MKTANFIASFFAGVATARVVAKDTACPAQAATEFAIAYGEPLLSYAHAFSQLPKGFPANKLYANTALATPNQTAIVSPNVDTLYMSQMYDISRDDLIVMVPEVDPNRYYAVSFYTPEGDNFLNLGSLLQTKAGKYLLTPAVTSDTAGKIVTGCKETYQGTVYSPRTLGYLLIRIVLRNQDSDIRAVNEIQRRFSTNTTARSGEPIGPELKATLFTNVSSVVVENLLAFMARFNQTIPPRNGQPVLPAGTTSNLSLAGIVSDGTYRKPDCVDLAQASSATNASITKYSQSPDFINNLSNGWTMLRPDLVGTYGDNYDARTATAVFGYLALTKDQALYPTYKEGFSLGANESYVLRFSGKPPVTDIGFWSVTMYDSRGTLVPNSINRYSLGDRSNLTYSDGTVVYGTDSDAPFDILIQASQPPANWTSNWLPSPSTPGSFKAILRFYVPTDALSNGTYTYPQVTKGAVRK